MSKVPNWRFPVQYPIDFVRRTLPGDSDKLTEKTPMKSVFHFLKRDYWRELYEEAFYAFTLSGPWLDPRKVIHRKALLIARTRPLPRRSTSSRQASAIN